eukprot:jgi/Hompol1/2069/HPOL_005659-RA
MSVRMRNCRGVREQDWCEGWREHAAFANTNSTLSAQLHLQARIRSDRSDIDAILALPEGLDDLVWQYEHLRQICLELNGLLIALESECTVDSCPEMKAGEWLYLCAAHTAPQGCPAIDYIAHTIDGATALLNLSKLFPSRMAVPEPSVKHMHNIARRLYRIFAHAWFHHKETFNEFESRSYLYARFLQLTTTKYRMISDKIAIIPQPSE